MKGVYIVFDVRPRPLMSVSSSSLSMTVAKVKTDEDLLVCTISNSSNHEKYQTPTYYF
jgi:hypothetical protein